jgi:ribonuclease Z
MIDCGEGTQLRLNKSKIRINKIDHVFLSHLHGDHYFGLIGLISTMHLFGRTKPLWIYGPSPIREIIELQLKHSETVLNFEIIYFFTDQSEESIIFENKDVIVRKFPLNHRIFCTGFVFREKPKKPKIRKEKIPPDFSLAKIAILKNGEDIYDDQGNLIYRNKDLTLPPKKSRSYAFCSDTKYDESILEFISDVDLLYHEATFANDMKERAENTFHSTAEQAATIAVKARARKLLLGHYSVRYKELDIILEEAKTIFEESYLSIEGSAIEIED